MVVEFRMHSFIHAIALVVGILALLVASESASNEYDVRGQLSLQGSGVVLSDQWSYPLALTYTPEISVYSPVSDALSIDANLALQFSVNHNEDLVEPTSTSAEVYRLNVQAKTESSDLKIGLQKINFGPALILRSLRWFDQLNPTDPTNTTLGVNALRFRCFLDNGATVWLWGLFANDEPKGYEQVATRANTLETGGRLEWPMLNGEVGINTHLRSTDVMGFSAIAVAEPLLEKRLGFDGRWDLGLGLWLEAVLVDQGAKGVDNNWYSMATLGTDYTLSLGNSIHFLAEHQLQQFSDSALSVNSPNHTTALQLSYPLSIFDSISGMSLVNWQDESTTNHISWNRAYDNWLISVSAFRSGQVDSQGFQATVVFNH